MTGLDYIKKSFYIGITGFGGPAILGYIKKIFVEERKQLDEKSFYEGLSLSQIIPGATAGNMLAYIASRKYSPFINILSQIAFLFPAVFSMFIFGYIYFTYGSIQLVKDIFSGLNVTVVVMMIATLEKIVVPLAKRKFNLFLLFLAFLLKMFTSLSIFVIIPIIILMVLIIDNTKSEKQNEITNTAFSLKNAKFEFILLIVFFSILLLAAKFSELDKNLLVFANMSKLGMMSFGGGFAAIPIVQQNLVEHLKWLTNKEFMDGIAIAQLTPGPILNIAVFAGMKIGGISAAIPGALGMFTPGFVIMLFASKFSSIVLAKPIFQKISKGILFAFNGVLIYVFIRFFRESILDIKSILVFFILLILQYKFKFGPMKLIGITIALTFLFKLIGF